MMNSKNRYASICLDSIKDSIILINQFPDGLVFLFRNYPSRFWKFLQHIDEMIEIIDKSKGV